MNLNIEKKDICEPSQASKEAFMTNNNLVKPNNGTNAQKRAYLFDFCIAAAHVVSDPTVKTYYKCLANKVKTLSDVQINAITGGAL